MSKKTDAAWSKIREGQRRIGLLQTNARGKLGIYAKRLAEGASDEELGKVASEGAVAFRTLSLACELAASGAEELVRADPFHTDRKRAFNMGQAAAHRHNVSFFHELSTSFVDLARFHGVAIGNIESDAERFSEKVVESEHNRTAA